MSKPFDAKNCVMSFSCYHQWSELVETIDPTIKHCVDCNKNVYLVDKVEDVVNAINYERCVYFKNMARPTLGVPSTYNDN
jgi:hypothetical protein